MEILLEARKMCMGSKILDPLIVWLNHMEIRENKRDRNTLMQELGQR